jgi:thiol:disulfide interchange protein DsbC
MKPPMKLLKTALVTLVLSLAFGALAQEATIRKNLGERLPNLPKIDEVSKAPMPGLFEVRVNGTEIFYTDAEGNFLILPVKNAFTVVRGNGKRKMAVFEDPNCGYCKRFERDLQKIDNVTIHMFLYPILGKDSVDKSRNIWCTKDRAKTWADWMLRDVPPASASCDTAALSSNVEFGAKHKITGTPTIVFADGSRVPGAINAQQIEKFLAEAK